MRIPFISSPEFKPRKHIGLNPNLSTETREIVELLDVFSQQLDWCCATVVWTRNLLLLLGVVVLLSVWPFIKIVADNQVHRAGGNVTATLPAPHLPQGKANP